MGTDEDIERLLLEDLNNARAAHESAQRELPNTTSGPSERSSGEGKVSTLAVWMNALREFSGFVLHGKVPDRFSEGRRTQSSVALAGHVS
jgi:hypothetical protein